MTTPEVFAELDPPPRLLKGPGPVGVDPRVLRAMSMPMLGQFDPAFTAYMNETMVLLRQIYRTKNQWSFLVNGTARAGVETMLVSMISPGDKVLVPIFGRFGHLLTEISARCGAEVVSIEREWGTVFTPDGIEDAIKTHKPRIVAVVHGDTSTTVAQPLGEIGALCRSRDILLYSDATATLGGMAIETDKWQVDAMSSGLQKCLSGPPGSSPITFNERVADLVNSRKHLEAGIKPVGFIDCNGPRIPSNYFDLAMLMDYWGPSRLNHHTEATSMLYAARESVRIALMEGDARFARHRLASDALCAGDGFDAVRRSEEQDAERHRRHHPQRRQCRRCTQDDARRLRHRNRHFVWTAARQDLAHRNDGLCLPQGERAHLPRRARRLFASLRLQGAARRRRRCGARELQQGVTQFVVSTRAGGGSNLSR
jgi:(S)-ureidoglycine-glyoxylate aminotransferase